jgi:hypothetical protein
MTAAGKITCLSNHQAHFTADHWKSLHTRANDIQHRGLEVNQLG